MQKVDLTGQRFGYLTVIGFNERKKYPCGGAVTMWNCKCDCGNIVVVSHSSLRAGTKSCGCKKYKYGADSHFYKHGECTTRLYKTHETMLKRCRDKKDKHYGGKGIKVCEEWSGEKGYENFRDWAYKNGYDENLNGLDCSIDRIDSNGNYCPDNCRWINASGQANNRSTNRYITYKGATHTIAEWARILDMPYSRIQGRLSKGWPADDIFEIGKLKANRKYQKIERTQVEI